MHLYFSPLACSMATRISLYEAGGDATFVQLDGKTKRLPDGTDYLTINPLGLVPTLRTDDGEVISENAAVLQYVADRFPAARLAPPAGTLARTRLQQWLCFIGTELHKAVFTPLLDRAAPEGAKAYAQDKAGPRLEVLDRHLGEPGRRFLLDDFSVADAYLFTVLGWTQVLPAIDLGKTPAIGRYLAGLADRPSVARAVAEERRLYLERAR